MSEGQVLSLGRRVDVAELVATAVMAFSSVVHANDRVLMPREMPAASAGH